MTLKEKFHQWLKTEPFSSKERPTLREAQCGQIADEYAIEFLDWCSSKEALDILVKLIDSKELDRNPTGKDLIEIFKKEKGL